MLQRLFDATETVDNCCICHIFGQVVDSVNQPLISPQVVSGILYKYFFQDFIFLICIFKYNNINC